MIQTALVSLCGSLMLLPGMHAQAPAPKPALGGLDPVELARGKEVPGRAELTASYGRYHYVFATKENQAAFEKDPRNRAIQLAGGCARMGPLSGAGSPARYVVFENKIYIFASDACRSTFNKDPKRYVDLPDPAPAATQEARAGGAKLLAAALQALGGADKIDALTNLQMSLPRSHGMGKDKVVGVLTTTIAFPDRLRHDETWGDWHGANALSGANSFERAAKNTRRLEEMEREYLLRELHRHPVALMRARQQPDFIALAAGQGKVGEQAVDLLKVAVAGATSTLSLEPQTGRVLAITYRGRPGIGAIGAIEKFYSDFKSIDGLTLPHTVRTTWDGKTIPNQSGTYSAVRVSVALDEDFFKGKESK